MITSPSGKKYVGQTIQKLETRMQQHAQGSCPFVRKGTKVTAFARAVDHYGWNAMKVEVMWRGPSELLDQMEVAVIREQDCIAPNGYNLVEGGNGNNMTALWQDPIRREALILNRKNSDKVKAANTANKQNCAEAQQKRRNTWEQKREALFAQMSIEDARKARARMRISRCKAQKKRLKRRLTLGLPASFCELSSREEKAQQQNIVSTRNREGSSCRVQNNFVLTRCRPSAEAIEGAYHDWMYGSDGVDSDED